MLGKSGKDLGMIFKLFWPLVQWQQQKIYLNVAPPCKRLILQDARLNFANKRRKDAISCWAVSNAQFNATPGPARGHNNFLAFENPKTTSQPYLWNLTHSRGENTTVTGSVNQIHPAGSSSQTGTKKERGKRNPDNQTKQTISKAE